MSYWCHVIALSTPVGTLFKNLVIGIYSSVCAVEYFSISYLAKNSSPPLVMSGPAT